MFNPTAFDQARFSVREGEITLSALQPFFDDKPIFRCKMLNSEELAQAEESANSQQVVSELLNRITAGNPHDKAAAIAEAAGISGDDVPGALRKMIEFVLAGVVEPALSRDQVLKISTNFPVEFKQLFNKIMSLTGEGAEIELKP
ncbi:MAG: hypothetical protein ACPGF7_09550 [Pontibacterium sp.]